MLNLTFLRSLYFEAKIRGIIAIRSIFGVEAGAWITLQQLLKVDSSQTISSIMSSFIDRSRQLEFIVYTLYNYCLYLSSINFSMNIPKSIEARLEASI